MKKYFYSILFLTFLQANTYSQSPNWEVNESRFQYTMTLVSFLNINGGTLSSSNDKVAAFVNGELRGSASLTYVNSTNRYLAYLVVFSNTTNETIKFKIYDSLNDQIVDVDTEINYRINGHYGNVFQAFSVAKPILSNKADITSFNFSNSNTDRTINDDKITIESSPFVANNIDKLNAVFAISNGAKLYDGTKIISSENNSLDFTTSKKLNVLSEDESVLKEWTIEIIDVDNDGDGVFSNTDCDDNEPLAHPGNTEVLNDGIDNDCDLSTPDVIVKKSITISADAKTKVYGESDPELTYQITSGTLESGDFLTGGLSRALGEDVGTYAVSSTLSNDNYDITFVAANLSITKKSIAITADAKTKVYGETDPELTYQITTGNLESGDVLSGGLTRTLGENIGDYAISSTVSNDNYEIVFVAANLSISKKEITITADAMTKVYGEVDPELTYQITSGNLESGDILTGGLSRTSGEDVGAYAISSTLSNNNYDITFVAANLSITKKGITITADAKTKVYGEADPELTYSITAGSLESGDFLTGGLSRTSGEDVGTYAISSTLSNNNYDIIFVAANLSITKKRITITADAKTKIYGDVDPELTYRITTGTIESGDNLIGLLTRTTGENVGDYTISSTLSNDNYDITFVPANLSITKKGVTITADAKTKIYGDADPELTYQITTGSLESGDFLTGGLSRTLGEDVGDYTVSLTLSNDNYDITFVAANLSITKKEITITADAKTKIYGETDPELTYQITSGTKETGDVLTGSLTRASGENVGDYVISSTLSNGNYDITFVAANLSITKKEITITADVKTKIYGETDPELTYQITFGSLESGDVLTGVLTRTSGENIGDYSISSTVSNDNYEITFVAANLSVTKKGITITADAKTKVYGETDPELTYQITTGNLESGDVLTGGLSRVLGENIGDYTISSTVSNNNYEITFVAANLSITKKGITITADAKTKVYGETDPELTYQITSGSLESGDVLSGGLTRTLGENIGDYAILSTVSNDNYEITFVTANLSISKKPITITADVKTKVYGESDPELTYQITSGSLESGDVLSGGLNRASGENIGDYAISSTLSNGNYDITFVAANLSISKKRNHNYSGCKDKGLWRI